MLNKKKIFLKKRENRNENLTAIAKENEYKVVVVRDNISNSRY